MRITSIAIATLLLQSVQFSSAKLRATPLGTKRQARKSNNSSSRRTRTQTQKGKSKKSNNGEDYLLGVQRKDHQRQDFGDDEPLEAATATTPPTVPSLERCSCSPIEYNFVLSLDQDCGNNQLEGSPGIDLTFCLLSTHETERSGKQGNKGRGGRQLHKTAVKKEERIKIDFDDKVALVDKRQLDGGDIEIVSIQFLEFDTSGKLIVLNQDDTYANTSLTNGDIATFKSISSDLDPTLPIEDQLDLLPGGVQVTLRGKVTDVATGEENIVSNRITWSYTNGCDVEPLSEGMGIGWTTIGELTVASNAFCPAAEFRTEAPTIASVTASPTTAPVTALTRCDSLDYITTPMNNADFDHNGFLSKDEYVTFTDTISGGWLTDNNFGTSFVDMPLALQEPYYILLCLCELYPNQLWGGKGCCKNDGSGVDNTGIRTNGTGEGEVPTKQERLYLKHVCEKMEIGLDYMGADLVMSATNAPTPAPTPAPIVGTASPSLGAIYTDEECNRWTTLLVSADLDLSNGLSESEYKLFLSSIQDPPYIAEYFKSYDGFDNLPWAFRVVHKSLACHCEELGFGDGCCEGVNAEVLLNGLSDGNNDGDIPLEASKDSPGVEEEIYKHLFCQQIAYVLTKSVPKPQPTIWPTDKPTLSPSPSTPM